ncbi:MAG TPA: hypothetical protein VM582_07675 [Candidatus Thermoplasmatota archaeon]|nr:hypothetical protein [Candidatus Thermoplasmatota archaeon]
MQTEKTMRPTTTMRAYFAECPKPDGTPDACAFQLRNEDRAQLLRFFADHVRETHKSPMDAKDIEAYVKEVRV